MEAIDSVTPTIEKEESPELLTVEADLARCALKAMSNEIGCAITKSKKCFFDTDDSEPCEFYCGQY